MDNFAHAIAMGSAFGMLAISACQGESQPVAEETTAAAPVETRNAGNTAGVSAATNSERAASPDCSKLRPAPLTPDAAPTETGARATLLEWGAALEQGKFDRAWCQYTNDGQGSGMDFAAYKAKWQGYDRLTVAMPGGRMEGAAGTSYYTAPTTITAEKDGKTTVLKGDVVLRRVNDVPGATEQDLQWQIRSADLAASA